MALEYLDMTFFGFSILNCVYGFALADVVELLKAFAHQTHHCGHSVIYIRLAGVKTPKWLE